MRGEEQQQKHLDFIQRPKLRKNMQIGEVVIYMAKIKMKLWSFAMITNITDFLHKMDILVVTLYLE